MSCDVASFVAECAEMRSCRPGASSSQDHVVIREPLKNALNLFNGLDDWVKKSPLPGLGTWDMGQYGAWHLT